jgi:hypothetical protein
MPQCNSSTIIIKNLKIFSYKMDGVHLLVLCAYSQNSYIDFLSPNMQNLTVFGGRGLTEEIKLK